MVPVISCDAVFLPSASNADTSVVSGASVGLPAIVSGAALVHAVVGGAGNAPIIVGGTTRSVHTVVNRAAQPPPTISCACCATFTGYTADALGTGGAADALASGGAALEPAAGGATDALAVGGNADALAVGSTARVLAVRGTSEMRVTGSATDAHAVGGTQMRSLFPVLKPRLRLAAPIARPPAAALRSHSLLAVLQTSSLQDSEVPPLCRMATRPPLVSHRLLSAALHVLPLHNVPSAALLSEWVVDQVC